MPWKELRFVCARDTAQSISGVLEDGEALAVTLADAEDRPIYEPDIGTTPLWKLTQVTALYAYDHPLEVELQRLKDRFGTSLPEPAVVVVEDEDWVRAGQQGFEARRFGERLWVVPSWSDPPAEAEVCLRIDPGLAFGTGAHPTTALCLEWLDARVRPGMAICDYGCGSGVLAVAAAVLGASRVDCTDIDPQALTATRQNGDLNEVGAKLLLADGPGDLSPPYDLVVANILAGPLLELAPTLCALLKPAGEMALAGLLIEQADDLVAAYEQEPGIQLVERTSQEGWERLGFRRTG